MGSIVYVAKRSLVPTHLANQSYAIEIDIQEPVRSRAVKKTVNRALGGAMEVLRDYADTQWQITFEPVWGTRLALMREFLDSTDGGEQFAIDLYGASSALKSMRRTDEGHIEEPFLRRGSELTDAFQISITAIQV